jgi:putative oxidoreductase
MNWENVARFVLTGSSDSESFAILLVRVLLGAFFAISGGYKLFVPSRRRLMHDTLVKTGVPLPQFMTFFVSAVEFAGGLLLIAGLMSSLACFMLLVDMLVAILTAKLSSIPKKLSMLDWLDDFLYLPEVLYVLFFVWLICSGPGRFSVDHSIAMRLLE